MGTGKVELTCALPMYRSKDIGWLALESLCRQEDIDFEWELVVMEEKHEAFGKANVHSYEERLRKVGCTRIKYTSLKYWIPLAEKWRLIAEQSSSFGFLLIAADCYSQPKRLAESYTLLKDFEWIQSPLGAFYDIASGTQCVFDHQLYKKTSEFRCALNMGFRTELTKAIPESDRRRYIDGWLYRKIAGYLHRDPLVGENNSRSWKNGIDTNGMNNISLQRQSFLVGTPKAPFRLPQAKEPSALIETVPDDIAQRLTEKASCAKSRRGFVRAGTGS